MRPMQTSNHKEKPRGLTSKSAYLALLFTVPVLLLFCLLGKWETGIGAWICAGVVLLVVRQRWDLRRHFWFWIIVALAVLVQIPVVLLIPWENRSLTGISLLPVGVLDYGLMYGCIKLTEKVFGARDETSEEN
jgi:hypothetical protein